MASDCSQDMLESLIAMTKEMIKSEAQYSTIARYLAKNCDRKLDMKNALVFLTNSHGVQLRNDVKYWIYGRDGVLESNTNTSSPVLSSSHLEFIENFDDLMAKVRVMPDEWTVIQITKQYSPFDVLEHVKDQSDTGIILARFSCGKLAERVNPYYVKIKSRNNTDENFIHCFRDLMKIRTNYFSNGGTRREMRLEYLNTECGLAKLLVELENHWLKEWKCLIRGRLEDKNLENEIYQQVKKILINFEKSDKELKMCSIESLDMVYQLTLSIHLMKNNEIIKVLNHALYGNNNGSGDNLEKLMEDLKGINSRKASEVRRAKNLPVILIIDKEFEVIPWEMLNPLLGQPTTRILSMHLLYALYKFHEPHIKNGYRVLKIDSGFCVINPSSDLKDCEKEITQFLAKNMPWMESEAGRAPDEKLLVSKCQHSDVFLYCGHGSGRQYWKAKNLKKSFVKGLVLLYGCSSNIPRTAGGRTPYQNDAYTYLTNGCPCQIGTIYELTSSDADAACKEMLMNILPLTAESGEMMAPKEPDVLKGVVAGKLVCKKYWSQCSFVARGLPCKTEAGNASKCS